MGTPHAPGQRAARAAEDEALVYLKMELALESRGHFYTRECCANAWYAIGAIALRRGDRKAAREAFAEAIKRVLKHGMAQTALALLDAPGGAVSAECRRPCRPHSRAP